MSRWWRAYDEALDDPKLQRMGLELVGAWFNLMCLASRHDGRLPAIDDVAFALRTTKTKAAGIVTRLVGAGLLDESETGFAPHNWSARQYKSDVSTERVKRSKERSRERSENVGGTSPDTEQIQNRTDDPASAVPPPEVPYAFEAGVIRLRKKDFDQWKSAFAHLDLSAELIGLEPWAAQQSNWFVAVSQALAKKNRETKIRIEQQKSAPAFRWNGGIEGVT